MKNTANDTTILITGGAGFIGSHVAEKFSKEGYRVVLVDDLSTGNLGNIKSIIDNENVTFYQADIRDYDQMKKVFEETKPQIIDHHAAQKSVSYSVEKPKHDLDLNLTGLLTLIELAGEYQVKQFVFVSSGGALSKEILGQEKSKESDIPQLQSPYAISKYAGEQYIKLYAKLKGFDYCVLRYANVYGPRQIADGECGVIPIFVNNILSGKGSVLTTYEDMPRGCTRDYVYVGDVAEANLLAVQNPANEVINIGSGEEVGILDIYYEILKVFQKDVPITIAGPRQGDIRRSVLDAKKALSTIGWKPTVDLSTGLKLIYESMGE
ncbi:SDR family NAD(P)-dependent oxidoreductase [Anaerosporobacter sp.]|uniref:SDR family NAD(P)-dependent oxidoreductase n=1 Tax=Anaerosporobacter sp. TaxID=1872529 RepID=UPI00286ED029|nr:SDR family NAD(P)-dependent oxidoreductase [Anaerosporobacter sp.]